LSFFLLGACDHTPKTPRPPTTEGINHGKYYTIITTLFYALTRTSLRAEGEEELIIMLFFSFGFSVVVAREGCF